MKSTISSNLDGMLLVNALVKFNGKKVQTTMQNSVIKIVFIGPSRKKCFHLWNPQRQFCCLIIVQS